VTDELHIEFTEAEKDATYGDVAVTFSVAAGIVRVEAHWSGMDELWGSSCTVRIPARIWAIAVPWIAERLNAPSPALQAE
jgi:hypothetical protein